jgi:hypothetical protein
MTNFIAFTIAAAWASTSAAADEGPAPPAKTTLDSFFANLQQQGLIGNASGTDAFQVEARRHEQPARGWRSATSRRT